MTGLLKVTPIQAASSELPLSIEEFAQAIDEAPKVADAPFSLTSLAAPSTATQRGLFDAAGERDK